MGGNVGSGSRSVGTHGSEKRLGDCNSGGGSRPSSPVRDGAAAGAGAVAVAGEGMTSTSDVDVENISLSDEELNEGDALLFKIRRSTSAPTNPDDRALKPKARQSVHPGVRHRVEVQYVVRIEVPVGTTVYRDVYCLNQRMYYLICPFIYNEVSRVVQYARIGLEL